MAIPFMRWKGKCSRTSWRKPVMPTVSPVIIEEFSRIVGVSKEKAKMVDSRQGEIDHFACAFMAILGSSPSIIEAFRQ